MMPVKSDEVEIMRRKGNKRKKDTGNVCSPCSSIATIPLTLHLSSLNSLSKQEKKMDTLQ
jgi:hypothetical protein